MQSDEKYGQNDGGDQMEAQHYYINGAQQDDVCDERVPLRVNCVGYEKRHTPFVTNTTRRDWYLQLMDEGELTRFVAKASKPARVPVAGAAGVGAAGVGAAGVGTGSVMTGLLVPGRVEFKVFGSGNGHDCAVDTPTAP